MGVFRKICSLLFEETDTEVIAEDELETITFREPKKEKKVVMEERHEEVYERAAQPVIKETKAVNETPQEHKKIFVNVDVEEKKPVVTKKEAIVHPRTTLKKSENKDYEYTPVISPMFGAKEEVKQPARKDNVKIMKKAAKKQNPLGTIISPYFGVNELNEFEEEAKEEIAAKEKEKFQHIDLPVNEVELQRFEEQEEKAIHNVSLDELISDEQEIDDEDDMMQISLFGESAPVRSDDTISFKINEKE